MLLQSIDLFRTDIFSAKLLIQKRYFFQAPSLWKKLIFSYKKERTLCLDVLIMLYNCWNNSKSRCFFIVSTWKSVDQDFQFPMSSDWRFDTSFYLRFEIPIHNDVQCYWTPWEVVFHICLFLMSYDRSDMSLSNIETIV